MAETQEQANRILNDFSNDLDDVIIEKLVGQVTTEQINEYYGYGNNCQIAELLIGAEELIQLLEEKDRIKAETAQ